VSLLIAVLLSYFFLEWPWTLIVILAAASFEAFEIWLWLRWRKVRSITGAESMIGSKGRTMGVCDPDGQAAIKGQVWSVECDERLERGTDIEVVGRDGLKLRVKRAG
jgi:membrane-bound serine protease (ClpP class)